MAPQRAGGGGGPVQRPEAAGAYLLHGPRPGHAEQRQAKVSRDEAAKPHAGREEGAQVWVRVVHLLVARERPVQRAGGARLQGRGKGHEERRHVPLGCMAVRWEANHRFALGASPALA